MWPYTVEENEMLSKPMKKTKSKLAKKNKPEWEWQPISNGKGHYWFLKPKH